MRIDFAGPLFSQPERAWNAAMAAVRSDSGHEVFLPRDEIQHLDALEAGPIFRHDVEGVRTADALAAVLDGADPDGGTSLECGLAFAPGIPIVAVRNDFRAGGDSLPGQRLPAINRMLSEAASAAVLLPEPTTPPEAVARSILDALAGLGTPTAPIRRPSAGS